MAQMNYGLMMMGYLNANYANGWAYMSEQDPRLTVLTPYGSSFYGAGLDVFKQPYLAVPMGVMPHFIHMPWRQASVCRRRGLLILEARSHIDNSFIFGLGIHFRKVRLNNFAIPGKVDASDRHLSIKHFEHPGESGEGFVLPDEHDMTGIQLREIEDINVLSDDEESAYARSVVEQNGMAKHVRKVPLMG